MILCLYGFDEKFELKEGVSLLNIHNKYLYRSLVNYFIYSHYDSEGNEIVFFDEHGERIKAENIIFVNDILEFKFDSKQIVDKFIKSYTISNIFHDVESREKELKLYKELISPIIEYANQLEIDFQYNEEIDVNYYLKLIGLDYSINNDRPIVDKIISLIRLILRINKAKLIVINRAIPYLTEEDINIIDDFCRKSATTLLFIDYLDDSEVVIANNMNVSKDFGIYSL